MASTVKELIFGKLSVFQSWYKHVKENRKRVILFLNLGVASIILFYALISAPKISSMLAVLYTTPLPSLLELELELEGLTAS